MKNVWNWIIKSLEQLWVEEETYKIEMKKNKNTNIMQNAKNMRG